MRIHERAGHPTAEVYELPIEVNEMSPSRPRTNRLRGIIVGVVALSALLMLAGQSIAIGAGQGELAAVRAGDRQVPRSQGRR